MDGETVGRPAVLILLGLAFAAWMPAAKSFPVDGVVIAVDPAARTMLVSHRPIGRYMPAMMMPFRVEEAKDLQGLYPGARVSFELVVGKRVRSPATYADRAAMTWQFPCRRSGAR